MPLSLYKLLSNCTDEQLRRICDYRKLPIPRSWEEEPEGRIRLLKTMVFHLEDYTQLSNTLADLESKDLLVLKHLMESGRLPEPGVGGHLADLGLILPGGDGWVVAERVADALADFDDCSLSFQGEPDALLQPAPLYGFSMALTSVLLRCVVGIRVLKGGLPAKKDLTQLLSRNVFLQEDRDATLLFTLLHRLGFLWSREGRVDTLVPAVLIHPPRWVAERAFASLLEHDLTLWDMPPAEDRRFFMEHLLERRGQVLSIQPFLTFLKTLHSLDENRTRTSFLPFLGRMGLIAMDGTREHLSLTAHGETLAQEYLLRDLRGTDAHWAPLMTEPPLVLQPTLEGLTPMFQNPHRLLKLAQLAEVEGLDTMVTFRIGPDTLVRALDFGLSLDDIKHRLGNRTGDSSAAMPSTLFQLLDDLGQRVGEVEVQQGKRLVRTRTAHLADELRLRPELLPLKLVPISDTVLEVQGNGNTYALLKAAGYLPKPGRFLPVSLDEEEDLYLWSMACLSFVDEKGMNHHLEPVRQMVRAALQRLHDEDPNLFQEVQKRVPMLHLGGGNQAAEEMRLILDYAAGRNLMVELTYLPPAAHRTQLRRVTPRTMEGDHLQAFCHLHQEEMAFRLTRIQGARLLNERGWNPGQAQAG